MSRRGTKFTLEVAFKTSALTQDEQSHLVRVYAVLAAGSICPALGCGYVLLESPTSVHHWALCLGSLVAAAAFGTWFSLESDWHVKRRFVLLMITCPFIGLYVVSFFGLFFNFDATVVLTAFLVMPGVLLCFALAALLTVRRPVLFISGSLSSMLVTFLTLNAVVWVDGKSTLGDITPYGFIVFFFTTVILNTQVTAEKFNVGEQGVLENAEAYIGNLLNAVVSLIFMLLKHVYRRLRGGASEEFEPLV